MKQEATQPGPAGSIDRSTRWEGPEETPPRGYLPAIDNPETDRDALGETLNNPNRAKVTDAGKTEGDQ